MKLFSKFRRCCQRVKLVDRCLVIFMAILLAQSVYHLFVGATSTPETNIIDIVIRTTSAAIFGYFLSVNFIKRPAPPPSGTVLPGPTVTSPPPGDRPTLTAARTIGFSAGSATSPAPPEVPPLQEEPVYESDTSHQQVVIATVIGVISLLALIFARNYADLTPNTLATLAQLRDFVSGCVGFLLGSPGSRPH